MGAIYSPAYQMFQTTTHDDQLGINAMPTTSTFLCESSPQTPIGASFYKQITRSQKDYAGNDIRASSINICSIIDVDNNDPTYNPFAVTYRGIWSGLNIGVNEPAYGSGFALETPVKMLNSGSPSNEPSCWFGFLMIGTAAKPTNARAWFTDNGVYGPIGLQPEVLNGYSLVTRNQYNGSPSGGPAAGLAIQNLNPSGPGASNTGNPPTFPWDIGVAVTGRATGGNHDGYTCCFQVGGRVGAWNGDAAFAGDQGQFAKGVVIKKNNAGNSTCRLGGFVTEGLGEGGGLVFGMDTNDVNRTSISRSKLGVMTLRGKLSFDRGGYAAASTATPTNITGKIAIYNEAGTLLGYLPIYGNL